VSVPPAAEVNFIGCDLPPAPVLPPVEIALGGEENCPAGWTMCVDPFNALRLALRERIYEMWQRQVRAACGPVNVDGGVQ
jgi:hypothetical protein